jgi:hypothetical protein
LLGYQIYNKCDPATHHWDRWFASLIKTWDLNKDHISGIVVNCNDKNLKLSLTRNFSKSPVFLHLHNLLLDIEPSVHEMIKGFDSVQKLQLFLGSLLADPDKIKVFEETLDHTDLKTVYALEGAMLLNSITQRKEDIQKLFFRPEMQDALNNFPTSIDFKNFEEILKVEKCVVEFLQMCKESLITCPLVPPSQCIVFFKILCSDLEELYLDTSAGDAFLLKKMIFEKIDVLEQHHSRQAWCNSLLFDPRFKNHVMGRENFAVEFQELKKTIVHEARRVGIENDGSDTSRQVANNGNDVSSASLVINTIKKLKYYTYKLVPLQTQRLQRYVVSQARTSNHASDSELCLKKLQTYMDEDTTPTNIKPVEFWNKRKESHPILSKLAMRYIELNCSVKDRFKLFKTTLINVQKEYHDSYLTLAFMSDYFWEL